MTRELSRRPASSRADSTPGGVRSSAIVSCSRSAVSPLGSTPATLVTRREPSIRSTSSWSTSDGASTSWRRYSAYCSSLERNIGNVKGLMR